MRNAPLIISPQQLVSTKERDTVLIDATWFMPNSPRDAYVEFSAKRIAGARFLDLDNIGANPHDSTLGLSHMMPSAEAFATACSNLGIQRNSHVVLYDSHGIFSSPRALFMLRAYGHTNSSVLDGGLPRWEAEGLPVTLKQPVHPTPTQYAPPSLDSKAVKTYEQVVSNACMKTEDSAIILDARSPDRFAGSSPEPRPGISSGHMPNSFNLPFGAFLYTTRNGDDSFTTFRPPAELRNTLVNAVGIEHADAILAGTRAAITSCGSGMTAGILWLGLRLLSTDAKIGLYDESWTGYASRQSSTILKG